MKHESQLLFRIHFLFAVFQHFSTATVTIALQPTFRRNTEGFSYVGNPQANHSNGLAKEAVSGPVVRNQ